MKASDGVLTDVPTQAKLIGSPAPDPFISRINRLGEEDFIAEIAPLYEQSPWVAAAAWGTRPFLDRVALIGRMHGIVQAAPRSRQLALIRAHPDLAGGLARSGGLEANSSREQRSLGLDCLIGSDSAKFDALNAAYRARFDMPFVIAVRSLTKDAIIEVFEQRLRHAADVEIATALGEIGKIAGFRLDDLR